MYHEYNFQSGHINHWNTWILEIISKMPFAGACANLGGGGGLALGMPNVVGVFIVTIGGCLFAT